MKYFIVSDIHGNYDKLIKALSDNNFNSEIDTLVVDGDAFDRGNQNKKVLQFLMSLPHRILIRGNHDLRLEQIINGASLQYYDIHNGTDITLEEFFGKDFPKKKDDSLLPLIHQYLNELKWYVKIGDYVITHTWLPFCEWEYSDKWEEADDDYWEDIIWDDQVDFLKYVKFPFKLITGHRPTWYVRYRLKLNNIVDNTITKKNTIKSFFIIVFL